MKILFPIIIAVALLTGVFSGCGDGGENGKVNVYNWGEYIDEDILRQFEADTGIQVNYKTFESNEQLYSVLKQGGVSYDVIIPSDYMISRLISEGMLEKLDFSNMPNASNIDQTLQKMGYDPTGEYSVPYTTGTVGIIYNGSVIKEEITSWSALFDEAYSGQIIMIDNSRDAIGIALKYLGYSQNTTDVNELNEAYELLVAQKPLLQAYVMDQVFEKLESGEAAIGVYYAGDYLTMLENNPDLKFTVPEEGSNRFVDCMCVPTGAKNKKNAEIFINYMCQTSVSLKNAEYIGYTSPNIEVKELIELDDEAMDIMYPDAEILDRCEFFVNLPQDILDLYDEFWVKLKS